MCSTSRIIHRGDVILTSKPALFTLSRSLRKENSSLPLQRCDQCFGPLGSSPTVCPSCSVVCYCKEKCREEAKDLHQRECGIMKVTKGNVSDNARLMLRLLLLLRRERGCGGDLVESRPEFGLERRFSQLLSHRDHLLGSPDRVAAVQNVRKEVERAVAKANKVNKLDVDVPRTLHEFVELSGKLLVNCFSRTDAYNKRLGAGLFLAVSVLDHSCQPNAAFSFNRKGLLEVRALERIKLEKGDRLEDKVKISYLDLMDSCSSRRSKLRSRYFFDCECARCTNGDPEVLFAVRCQNAAGCSGRPLLFGPATTCHDLLNRNIRCKKCGQEPDEQTLIRYESLYSAAQSALNNPECCDAEALLSRLTGFLHPTHFLYTRLAKRVFEAKLQQGRDGAQAARELGHLCVGTYDKLKPYCLPTLALLMLKLAKVEHLYFNKTEEDVEDNQEMLKETLRTIALAYGRDHDLYLEAREMVKDGGDENISL